MKLVCRDMPQEEWAGAALLAQQFLKEYPDRMGFNNFVIYTPPGLPSRVVYRTKTSVIVRGT